ncbi:MAG: four helix bundle protein [Clostridiales bacterium]|nr:four helix bundle protein [Clostridiales bacterium]
MGYPQRNGEKYQPRNGEQSEFILITKAKDLVKHTYMMTGEKRFPKKHYKLVQRLQDTTIEIFERVQEANELDLSDPQEFRERQYDQKKAMTKCKTVLFLIEIALERGMISKSQCDTWTNYVVEVKRMTASWKKKDRERATAQWRNAPPR